MCMLRVCVCGVLVCTSTVLLVCLCECVFLVASELFLLTTIIPI